MFVDRLKIIAQGGKGGDGCVSFRREKSVPRGGPDGGDGGHGGSVVVVAEEGVNSLAAHTGHVHWRGGDGERGYACNCHGKNADDLLIRVPPGTVVIDAEGRHVLKDLVQPGEHVTIAQGGRGGKGNTFFKSATNRAPRQSMPGGKGEQKTVILELKVIADVGLVGKPNAGKSTLLSRLSRAKPEIADYPFTTKHPNLGMVHVDGEIDFVMADIPGLIEGAHRGAGLGHDFLRHIQRTGILVHLVEPAPADGTEPLVNYRAIRSELEQYDPELVRRPEIVAVTKADLPEAAAVQEQLGKELQSEVLLISAVTGEGLNVLLRRIAAVLAEAEQAH